MELDPQKILPELARLGYNPAVADQRRTEYPSLTDCTFLDHAGSTPPAASALGAFSAALTTALFSNPHSPSPSSLATTLKVDAVRLRVLSYLRADPAHYDVVFTANATAAMKLVAESFTGLPGGFDHFYHADAHTSLIGIRGCARRAECLDDDAVESWLDTPDTSDTPRLFAWPAQSNFSGRRPPKSWSGRARAKENLYTLLDAAALLSTSPLDLSDPSTSPDFTALSFHKIFGHPDLGALIVRRDAAHMLRHRRYFGGGTVDSLTATDTAYVQRKQETPHDWLEDGTLPFHSIIALDCALDTHHKLYSSPEKVSAHTTALCRFTAGRLAVMKHHNGEPVCVFYGSNYGDAALQGAVVAFNMKRSDGAWIGYAEAEKLFAVKEIHLRSGGMCNPGGIQRLVGLSAEEIKANYAAGHKCSDDHDVMNGKPTGAVRVSFGAMSTLEDALAFLRVVEEFYVEREGGLSVVDTPIPAVPSDQPSTHGKVESLMIYPIKSCAGFPIPPNTRWPLRPHGLLLDREFCLYHLGTTRALSQKQYPKMVFVRPVVNPTRTALTITVHHRPDLGTLTIPLNTPAQTCSSPTRVCGDQVESFTYDDAHIVSFFTEAVGVGCTLARMPPESGTRNYKPHLKDEQKEDAKAPKILLSNESPILMVNSRSVVAVNRLISQSGGKTTKPDVFRANIVLDAGDAWEEDTWKTLRIGRETYELLGSCRRCHMICIDQETAQKDEEPFATLSKERRRDGKVWFGQHAMHLGGLTEGTVGVGDVVEVMESRVVKEEDDEGEFVKVEAVKGSGEGKGGMKVLERQASGSSGERVEKVVSKGGGKEAGREKGERGKKRGSFMKGVKALIPRFA